MKGVHLIVKGKVQGVFYRKSTRRKAEETGICGWVRNLPDGDVEIWAEGTEAVLKEFVDWCYTGPEKADVKEVLQEEVVVKGFSDFSIK